MAMAFGASAATPVRWVTARARPLCGTVCENVARQSRSVVPSISVSVPSSSSSSSSSLLSLRRPCDSHVLARQRCRGAFAASRLIARMCASSESVPTATTGRAQASSESADNNSDDDVQFAPPPIQIRLHSASASIPHPDKAETGGEDAHFVTQWALAVFDGVGGWQSVGVDSGEYSRTLSKKVEKNVLQFGPENVVRAMEEANVETERSTIGSTTALCVALCTKTSLLHGCNVGDSGLVVFRDDELLFRTTEQQHYFNCPYQVGTESMDTPTKSGQRFTCALKPNDLLVLGTDGLFDNVPHSVIFSEIKRADPENNAEPKIVADAIAQLAFNISCDKKVISPFGQSAFLNGYKYEGGKQDDITVIFARVMAFDEERPEESSKDAESKDESATAPPNISDATQLNQKQAIRMREGLFRRRT